MIKEDVTNDAHLVVACSKENVATVEAGIFIQGIAVIQGQLGAAVICVGLEVDHAGNRIGSIGSGSPIL